MNLAGIGLALAMAIVTGDSHPAIAFAQQSATWVLKIGQQRIERKPL